MCKTIRGELIVVGALLVMIMATAQPSPARNLALFDRTQGLLSASDKDIIEQGVSVQLELVNQFYMTGKPMTITRFGEDAPEGSYALKFTTSGYPCWNAGNVAVVNVAHTAQGGVSYTLGCAEHEATEVMTHKQICDEPVTRLVALSALYQGVMITDFMLPAKDCSADAKCDYLREIGH